MDASRVQVYPILSARTSLAFLFFLIILELGSWGSNNSESLFQTTRFLPFFVFHADLTLFIYIFELKLFLGFQTHKHIQYTSIAYFHNIRLFHHHRRMWAITSYSSLQRIHFAEWSNFNINREMQYSYSLIYSTDLRERCYIVNNEIKIWNIPNTLFEKRFAWKHLPGFNSNFFHVNEIRSF